MSVLDWAAEAFPASVGSKSRIWRKPGRALTRRDGAETNPYSPVACASLLLMAGLIIGFGPAIQGFLAQLW